MEAHIGAAPLVVICFMYRSTVHIAVDFDTVSTFVGPNGTRFAQPFHGPQTAGFSGPTPSNGSRNEFVRIKIITSRAI